MEGEKKALQGKTTESISVLRRAASDKQSSKQRAHTTKPSPKTARLCLKTSSYRPVIYHTGSHFGLLTVAAQPRSSTGVFERWGVEKNTNI